MAVNGDSAALQAGSETGGQQLVMALRTLDEIVFEDLTRPHGFPDAEHLHWNKGQVERTLLERKYPDGKSLLVFMAESGRENGRSRTSTMPISEWYDFIRAYDRVPASINKTLRNLTEQKTMNIVDFISFYIGYFRYHRFLTRTESMQIPARRGVFVHVGHNYMSLLNDQLENLDSTGMILRMANWGRYSRHIDLKSQFEYDILKAKYPRVPTAG